MSPAAAAARARVARARAALPARPRLTVLSPPPSTRFRVPFAASCAAVLVASLLGVLVLNIVLARGAYDEHVLELRQTELTEREQELSERLSVQASPAVLSERARALGMVPSANPAFIRLSDGTVLGSPTPAGGDVPMGSVIPPVDLDHTAEAAAEQGAAAAAAEAARAQAEADRQAAERESGGDAATGGGLPSATPQDGATAGGGASAPPQAPVGDGAVVRGTTP